MLIGEGDETIIDCNGDRSAINITNAVSVNLRDFKVIGTSVGGATEIINIDENSNNPVRVENLRIVGNVSDLGTGIEVNSDNCFILKNKVTDCWNGILIYGNENIIQANICRDNQSGGILVSGNENHITSNICNDNDLGISVLTGTENTILSNEARGNTTSNFQNSGTNTFGDATLNNFA